MQASTAQSSQQYRQGLGEAGSCAGWEGQDPVSWALNEASGSGGQH